jgi:hypothetical protein
MAIPEGLSDCSQIAIALGYCFGESCKCAAIAIWYNSRNEELPVCQEHLDWLLYVLEAEQVSPGVWVVKKENS